MKSIIFLSLFILSSGFVYAQLSQADQILNQSILDYQYAKFEIDGTFEQIQKSDIRLTGRNDVQVHVRQNPLKFYPYYDGWEFFIKYDEIPTVFKSSTST